MRLQAAGCSDVGSVRSRNEDVWAELPAQGLYVLADGMGGHQGGDVAAKLAVETICRYVDAHAPLPCEEAQEQLREAIRLANEAVLHRASNDRNLWGMGSTVCCLYACDNEVVYAHVGDSRIYHLRAQTLQQLTQDHSLVTQMLASGQIGPKEAEAFIYKHIITRAVGTRRRVRADTASLDPLPGDRFLLCSDGLTDLIPDDQIATLLAAQLPLNQVAQSLIDAALEAGGLDNITVIVLEVTDETHLSGQ